MKIKIQRDKLLHFVVCMIVAAVTAALLGVVGASAWPAAVGGFVAAMACGVGKEYGDSKAPGNRWDRADISADAVGAIFGAAIGAAMCML